MLKKIVLLLLVFIAYAVYARFVFAPHDLKNFSLIDDGQLIKYGVFLKRCLVEHSCLEFKTQIIDKLPDVGLSRSGSWLIHGALYQGSWVNAEFQHTLRVYGVGGIMVLLLVVLGISAGIGMIPILLGAAVFVTSFSFTENVIRLGPNEPFIVIFLGIFSLIFLNFNKLEKKNRTVAMVLLFVSLIYFLLIKEVTIAILPAILLTGLFYPTLIKSWNLISLVVLSGGIYFLVKYLLRGSVYGFNYAGNYNLNPIYVLKNSLNYAKMLFEALNPFISLTLIGAPVLLVLSKFRKRIVDHNLVFWFLIFVSFTAINFPWKYVYDRYMLPAIFAFCIMLTILIGRTLKELETYMKISSTKYALFNIGLFVILSNIFFSGMSEHLAKAINYQMWFKTFTEFEAGGVRAISQKDDTVYLNATDQVENWEVTYEIPMHIDYFYGGKPEIKVVGGEMPHDGYLFSASSLVPAYDPMYLGKQGNKIVERADYLVPVIDVDNFIQGFRLRPIQSFGKHKTLEGGGEFYWEIRELQ